MGSYEFLPSSELLTMIGQAMCHDQTITVDICANALFVVAGYSFEQLNTVSVKSQCSVRIFKSSNTVARHGDVPCRVAMSDAVCIELNIGVTRGSYWWLRNRILLLHKTENIKHLEWRVVIKFNVQTLSGCTTATRQSLKKSCPMYICRIPGRNHLLVVGLYCWLRCTVR
jgi:hypothetical protein